MCTHKQDLKFQLILRLIQQKNKQKLWVSTTFVVHELNGESGLKTAQTNILATKTQAQSEQANATHTGYILKVPTEN